jgi:predicted pPIWI-associating nuclease
VPSNPADAFLDILDRLLAGLSGVAPLTSEQRNIVRSVAGAWFGEYRHTFEEMLGEHTSLVAIDEGIESALTLSSGTASRRTVSRTVKQTRTHFVESLHLTLSRAYWSRVTVRSPAGRDDQVAAQLRVLDREIAVSYEQALRDLSDENRLTYRAPAAELREVLAEVLRTLAPDSRVQNVAWFKEARKSDPEKKEHPIRADRVRFILERRGSAVSDTVRSYAAMVEERLSDVVNATYRRGSTATHAGTERNEVLTQLPYLNALLKELLTVAGISPS